MASWEKVLEISPKWPIIWTLSLGAIFPLYYILFFSLIEKRLFPPPYTQQKEALYRLYIYSLEESENFDVVCSRDEDANIDDILERVKQENFQVAIYYPSEITSFAPEILWVFVSRNLQSGIVSKLEYEVRLFNLSVERGQPTPLIEICQDVTNLYQCSASAPPLRLRANVISEFSRFYVVLRFRPLQNQIQMGIQITIFYNDRETECQLIAYPKELSIQVVEAAWEVGYILSMLEVLVRSLILHILLPPGSNYLLVALTSIITWQRATTRHKNEGSNGKDNKNEGSQEDKGVFSRLRRVFTRLWRVFRPFASDFASVLFVEILILFLLLGTIQWPISIIILAILIVAVPVAFWIIGIMWKVLRQKKGLPEARRLREYYKKLESRGEKHE